MPLNLFYRHPKLYLMPNNGRFGMKDMTPKEKYRKLCQTEPTIPIFSRDWWLDIVCGEENWDVILYESDKIEASMPLYIPKQGVITMPIYTQTMGPWLAPLPKETKYAHQLLTKQEILRFFVEKLRIFSHFHQNFSYQITDWLPFYWNNYTQTTRYTYILENIYDTQRLWNNMQTNIRRNIQKAETKYNISVRRGIPTDEFLRVQALSFKRQGKQAPRNTELKQLIEVSRQRGQGDIWGGFDSKGQLHAAVFIVWQSSSAYYLAGGGDPELRTSGAHSLVLWKAIQDVAAYTQTFDFEGSMLPGVERFFREFGAKQIPYFAINKGKLSLYHRACIKLNRLLRDIL